MTERITRGRRQYSTPSGLIVLFDQPFKPMPGQRWARSPSDPSFPATSGPSLMDQMVVVCDEAALGLTPPSTLDDVRQLVSGLPYAPAAVITARIAALLWPIRDEPEHQLELAKQIFEHAGIINDFRAFLDSDLGPKRYIFHEQQLFVLMRLILESGAEGDGSLSWTADNEYDFRRALIKVTSVVAQGSSKLRESVHMGDHLLGYLTQNSFYNAMAQPLLAYQRAWRIFVELPATPEAQTHPSACDFETWHRKRLGVGLRELLVVGHAAGRAAQAEGLPKEQLAALPPLAPRLLAPVVQ
jgi:hypothetical protein